MSGVCTMDSLTCRSPSRCATCVHFDDALGCALEADLEAVLAGMEAKATKVRRPAPVLVMVDARRVHA